MLNKENYVPWSSRLLRYAKSQPNGKLIYNSIINGPYVRRMVPEPGDTNREVPVNETFHPEWSRHVTIVHQTKDLHTPDYTQLYDFLKYNQKEVDELKAERLTKIQDPLALMANSNNPYAFPAPHQDQPSFNKNYLQQPMPNPEDIIDPTTAMNMELPLMAKAFKLNYSTPTNNNQRISSNPHNRQIGQPGMNMGQDRQIQMVGDGSAEVHDYESYDDNDIFNMFTQEEQYTELLEPILEPHQVPQNDNDVISENLAIEVEKVNMLNRKLKETNADLTTELARFKNQEKMTLETHNWSSSAHQELHKIVKDENFPIVNQVDARVQNFEIQFLKEATKFVRDFKSLVKEADESLAKHKDLELEIKRLLRAVVSQDIMSVVQNDSVVDTSNL
nr:hypothetical protein [Tanacetum cinerariifolium]GEZ74045.1 hypothetical protein [Tanacetum cinerariifolium]